LQEYIDTATRWVLEIKAKILEQKPPKSNN